MKTDHRDFRCIGIFTSGIWDNMFYVFIVALSKVIGKIAQSYKTAAFKELQYVFFSREVYPWESGFYF